MIVLALYLVKWGTFFAVLLGFLLHSVYGLYVQTYNYWYKPAIDSVFCRY